MVSTRLLQEQKEVLTCCRHSPRESAQNLPRTRSSSRYDLMLLLLQAKLTLQSWHADRRPHSGLPWRPCPEAQAGTQCPSVGLLLVFLTSPPSPSVRCSWSPRWWSSPPLERASVHPSCWSLGTRGQQGQGQSRPTQVTDWETAALQHI